VLGDVSTGAQDDLQRATGIARHMVTRYGMSEALAKLLIEKELVDRETLLGLLAVSAH